MPLQHKHRPKTLEEFYGNEEVVSSLESVLSRKVETPHSFLFTGGSGMGKTTLARIVKDHLKCNLAEYREYDSSDERGIDAIRQIKEEIKYRPLIGSCKVLLLDECHGLTHSSQEALLKMLEEPPSYVYFILATTNPEKLKITLKRRCHACKLSPLTQRQLTTLLRKILKKEKIDDFKLDIIRDIVDNSEGSAGRAVKLLDSVIDMNDDRLIEKAIQNDNIESTEAIEICRAIMAKKSWKEISTILKGFSGDVEGARYMILNYFTTVLLNKGDERTAEIMTMFTDSFISTGKAGLTLACYLARRV